MRRSCVYHLWWVYPERNEASISVLSLKSMTWIFTCILNGDTESKQVTHVKAMVKWLCVKHTESNGSHENDSHKEDREYVSMFWLGTNKIPPATDADT